MKNIVCSEIRILFQSNTSRKSLYSYNKNKYYECYSSEVISHIISNYFENNFMQIKSKTFLPEVWSHYLTADVKEHGQ